MEDAHGDLTDRHDKGRHYYHDDMQVNQTTLAWRAPRVQDDRDGDAKVWTRSWRPGSVQPADEEGTTAQSYCT
jgi:hypothetical protein